MYLHLGSGCHFVPHSHFPQHWQPYENHPSLPKGFCRTGMWLHRGWQIPQLSCYSSSDAKLQGCSPRGSLFCSGGNCRSKIFLYLLWYWIKGFGNSCLSGWQWELCWGRDRLSLSDVSTTNTSHHLWFQGRALDPYPTLLCSPCHLPSTKSWAGTGRKCPVCSRYSTSEKPTRKWLHVHTVPKVSSCAEEERMGQMTLPYHKESQKQKQYIHQSYLTAHILMEPRTLFFWVVHL